MSRRDLHCLHTMMRAAYFVKALFKTLPFQNDERLYAPKNGVATQMDAFSLDVFIKLKCRSKCFIHICIVHVDKQYTCM